MTVNRMRERERSDTQQRGQGRDSNPGPLQKGQSPRIWDARSTNWAKWRLKITSLISREENSDFYIRRIFFKILSPFGSLSPGRLQRMSSASLWDVFSARRINTRVLLSRSAGSQGHELELRNHWFSESTDGKSKHKICQGPFPNKQTNKQTNTNKVGRLCTM